MSRAAAIPRLRLLGAGSALAWIALVLLGFARHAEAGTPVRPAASEPRLVLIATVDAQLACEDVDDDAGPAQLAALLPPIPSLPADDVRPHHCDAVSCGGRSARIDLAARGPPSRQPA